MRGEVLPAQAQPGYKCPVASNVLSVEITQQASPASYHHQKPTTSRFVVLVLSEMLCESKYSRGEYGYLCLCGACIVLVSPVFFDDDLLISLIQARLLGFLLLLCHYSSSWRIVSCADNEPQIFGNCHAFNKLVGLDQRLTSADRRSTIVRHRNQPMAGDGVVATEPALKYPEIRILLQRRKALARKTF